MKNHRRFRKRSRSALLRDRSFFQPKTLQELATEQGVGPVKDISVFAGGFPEDENIDEVMEEIYRMREPQRGRQRR
jgi:hypothetical protein